jgi:hypothetical protein
LLYNGQIDPELVNNGVSVTAGEQLGVYDEADPRAAYKRGVYFDGGDYLTLSPLMINHSFNTRFWIRAKNANGTLFSIKNM